mgnify:CR=1 FL=1
MAIILIHSNIIYKDINISEEEMENTDSDTGTVDEEPVADEILETDVVVPTFLS